jgi:hypothetical protein
MGMNGGYLIDMDISKYADRRSDDTIDHGFLREMLRRRVSDGVITRVTGKWLNAGVMDGGTRIYPERGTAQGGVISPLLSNLYLHEVLDDWYVKEVQPRMKGKTYLVRYADDAVNGCENREDAERILNVLAARFEKYGCKTTPGKDTAAGLHKTGGRTEEKEGELYVSGVHALLEQIPGREVNSGAEDGQDAAKPGADGDKHLVQSEPTQADTRTTGNAESETNRPYGHYAYYGISLNFRSIAEYYDRVRILWRTWLNSMSRKAGMNWKSYLNYLKEFPLPKPGIVHSYCSAKL